VVSQFGLLPLTLHSGRREGAVGTRWNAAVADSTDSSSVLEGLGDNYKDSTFSAPPDNGHIGVTSSTTIRIRPRDAHFVLLIGWLNPNSLDNYWQAHPELTQQSTGVVMDVHLRQQVAFGDVVSVRGGISSGETIISRTLRK